MKLYTYVDENTSLAFPNEQDQAELYSFTYDAKRMGGAPTISFSLMHPTCLDNVWTEQVYVSFNGEKYFLNQVPTSSYSNEDARYKHEGSFVSERVALDNVYFFDVVTDDTKNDKPVSNSSKVTFFGDIFEFAQRLNYSLQYSHLAYNVVLDSGVTSEAKLMSFENQFFSSVLQEIYNTFKLPYYFDGKTIHIGEKSTVLEQEFEYGYDNALLSVQKSNANYRIINRCSGIGSDENIPYYYPNLSPYGTVAYYYNGVETDKVNVVDWQKFSRCGLAGVLTCVFEETNSSKSEILADNFNDFMSGIEFGSYPVDQPQYNWIAKKTIKVPYPNSKLFVSFSTDISSLQHVIVIRDKDDIEVYRQPSFGLFQIDGLDIDYGTYTIEIILNLGNANGLTDELVRLKSKISIIAQEIINVDSSHWSLNGKGAVNLGSIGVTFVGEPEYGDTITFDIKEKRIPIVGNLMPYKYRDTDGADRFYNAINDTYLKTDGSGEYYKFSNPYVDGKPREYILEVDGIKPSIEGMQNSDNKRIDVFTKFEYDDNDNDDVDENGKYIHPYFFAKLRKFDGDNGFNLFAHAIEGKPMTIAMTSGTCGACEWTIAVGENTQLNHVQVYEEDTIDENGEFHEAGSLKRNASGDVLCGQGYVAQDIQNDTRNNEVWIALKKDINTFGVVMPNATHKYRPAPLDTFVILHIALPQSYIESAEKRLEEEIIKYMSQNNSEKFNFSIKFSRIYLEEHPEVLAVLDENVMIKVRYNNFLYNLYVSSYTYKANANEALPEITVQLSDTLTVNRGLAQNIVSQVKRDVGAMLDTAMTAELVERGVLTTNAPSSKVTGDFSFNSSVEIGGRVSSQGFASDSVWGTGWSIYKDPNGAWVLEADKVIVRDNLVVNEIETNKTQAKGGREILSAAAMECNAVYETADGYACYFDSKEGSVANLFVVGDIAYSQTFDATNNVERQYKREVLSIGTNHILLAKGEVYGSAPQIGDVIIQYGNVTDRTRQSVIVRDVIGGGYEKMISGLNSPIADGKPYYFAGREDGDTPRWFVGDSRGDHIEYKDGKLNIIADVTFGSGSSGLTDIPEFGDLVDRMDEVEETTSAEYVIWFMEDGAPEDYAPTLDNYPAVDWVTEEEIASHEWDIFYNRYSGQAWRFLEGNWREITDADTIAALTKASEAKKQAEALQYIKDALDTDDMTTNISNGLVLTGFVGVKDASENIVAAMMNATAGGEDQPVLPYFAAGITDATRISESSKLKIDIDGRIEQRDTDVTNLELQRRLKMSVGQIEFSLGENAPEVRLTPDKHVATPSDVMMFKELAQETTEAELKVRLPQNVRLIDEGNFEGQSGATVKRIASIQIGRYCDKITVPAGTATSQSYTHTFAITPRLVADDGELIAEGEVTTIGHRTEASETLGRIGAITYNTSANDVVFNKVVHFELVYTTTRTGEMPDVIVPSFGAVVEYKAFRLDDTYLYITATNNISRSAYDNVFFGNGLFFAKSATQYGGLLVDDTNGAVMEFRNGNQGLRFSAQGLQKWDSTNEQWVSV